MSLRHRSAPSLILLSNGSIFKMISQAPSVKTIKRKTPLKAEDFSRFGYNKHYRYYFNTFHARMQVPLTSAICTMMAMVKTEESVQSSHRFLNCFLMAHQDTLPVPAETVERWTHPPFPGYLDELGWIVAEDYFGQTWVTPATGRSVYSL
ncbi:hypothetical protein B0H13DRAFT_1910622 [Mycena leptocephala]|nr:hypothetical protein B0H13DRAFT_1910622 [Mycena leptocephala]